METEIFGRKDKKTVENYIRNQELEDQVKDKRSIKEYKDPFTGK